MDAHKLKARNYRNWRNYTRMVNVFDFVIGIMNKKGFEWISMLGKILFLEDKR